MAKGLNNRDLDRVLGAFTEQHPHLAGAVCADQGIRLMNINSQLAELVLNWFTRKSIPVLSVHDSFIIDYTHVGELKQVMGLAAKQIVGRELNMAADGPGLDELEWADHVKLHFRSWREIPRCLGYLSRLKTWEDLKGKAVTPYLV